MWSAASRERRRHDVVKKDQRSQFERDRDRILYTSAFHRLAGVTQVVRAGEQEVVHNRQQHSLKVAQVGRRLAQICVEKYPKIASSVGVDPEVVEAACLAHDLGHPPFGHIGESALDELTQAVKEPDGFEGNAQTFRILTQLSIRFDDHPGLDLTRATLAATLKYPWKRDHKNPDKSTKWSAYKCDLKDFRFARRNHKHDFKTPEAALMDWADDIAYSVHDLEDFHRCGAISWIEIFNEFTAPDIVNRAVSKWHNAPSNAKTLLEDGYSRIEELFLYGFEELVYERYVGSREQRLALRRLTSTLIARYIHAVTLTDDDNSVKISEEELSEVLILKQIFRDHVISSPSLMAQQYGQKKIITGLHEVFYAESAHGFPKILPQKLRHFWDLSDGNRARFAADCIASLTEREAVGLHARLFGVSDSSVLDPIVR